MFITLTFDVFTVIKLDSTGASYWHMTCINARPLKVSWLMPEIFSDTKTSLKMSVMYFKACHESKMYSKTSYLHTLILSKVHEN